MSLVYEGTSAGGYGLASKCSSLMPYNIPPEGVGLAYEHSLSFDSDFESGNLYRAVQREDATYDLFLRSDLHTHGHTQVKEEKKKDETIDYHSHLIFFFKIILLLLICDSGFISLFLIPIRPRWFAWQNRASRFPPLESALM